MMRRARWFAAVSSATLGLAGLAGCQSMNSPMQASWNQRGEEVVVRAAEPDDPSSLPSLQLRAMPSSDQATDPFAPITVEQFLPPSGRGPQNFTEGTTATAGYVSAPVATGPVVPPAPMAIAAPLATPMTMHTPMSHTWEPSGSCGQCGHAAMGCGSSFTGMVENMVIFAGVDYFSNSGMINHDRLINAAASLGVIPVDTPDLDPHRTGSIITLNAGAPFTPDGALAFQVGGTYTETEEGAQGFFTIGMYHRCQPGGKLGLNWGVVYDIAYDDFIDYVIGQIRLKAGFPISPRDEIGGWLTVGTNIEHVALPGTDRIIGDPNQQIFRDEILARVRPEGQGHFFWRHAFTGGSDATVFVGGRENLGGTFLLGYTAQVPLTDCWAVMSGGHWSNDANDRGSYDLYLGVGLFPGGNARSAGVCGNRYLPYQDAANNTFMPMSIEPRVLQLLEVPPPVRAPL